MARLTFIWTLAMALALTLASGAAAQGSAVTVTFDNE